MDIRELFTPAAIAANYEEVASNQIPYIGTALFPARKKAGLDLSWIRGAKGLPVSLMPSAFDAKATFRDRPGFTKLETEMPFFREGFKIKEKDRQEILRVQESNDPYLDTVLANIYDDANNLIEGANVVPERMRMALLFPANGNPGITFKANGVDYTYNYDPNNDWKNSNYFALTNTKWTNTSGADPFVDIETAQNAIRAKTGSEPKTLIMNSYTFGLLKNLDALKNRFLTTTGRNVAYITKGDVLSIIGDTLGLDIVVYDKQYKDESGTVQNFVPNGFVALIPDGALGSTWYSVTPEELDLMTGNSKAQVSVVNTGVAITQIIDEHPVNINTFASEIVLPSYERMDEVALLKVI